MKNILPLSAIAVFLLLVGACTQRPLTLRDVETFPQCASAYVEQDQNLIPPQKQQALAAEFLSCWFSPWTGTKTPIAKEKLLERYQRIMAQGGLGENLRPLTTSFLKKLVANTSLADYPARDAPGISTRAVHLRVLPTHRPRFRERCGPDGYPFDLFQESVLWPGTPLILRHISRDGRWAFVEAGFVGGWMPTGDFAAVDENLINAVFESPQIILVKDHIPLLSAENRFLAEGRIGMLLPTTGDQVLFPVRKGNRAFLEPVQLAGDAFAPFPLAMRRSHAAAIIDELKNQPYGWGGLYENRDCSSLLRDYFTVFGVWLPRNSYAQSRSGLFQTMEGLNFSAKKTLVLEAGIPFLHLVGRRGHVALYIGEYEGQPVFFHALWGIPYKTLFDDKSKRIIISRAVFTGAAPGQEHQAVRRAGKPLLESMDFLTDPTGQDHGIHP